MAKSKLKYWLGDGKATLIKIASNSRTDKEIYEAMGVSKQSFNKYKQNADFFAIIKNAKEQHIQDNTERLIQLHEDMWKQAHQQTIEETVQEVETRDGKEYKYMRKTTKVLGGDATLQIYLDKTYGNNINSQEIQTRIELNRARAEVQRLVLNPDLDEATKAKLESVREILGGVESVIGKAK